MPIWMRGPSTTTTTAEKNRLQKKFIDEHPREELSRLLQADGKTGIGSNSSMVGCPVGSVLFPLGKANDRTDKKTAGKIAKVLNSSKTAR